MTPPTPVSFAFTHRRQVPLASPPVVQGYLHAKHGLDHGVKLLTAADKLYTRQR